MSIFKKKNKDMLEEELLSDNDNKIEDEIKETTGKVSAQTEDNAEEKSVDKEDAEDKDLRDIPDEEKREKKKRKKKRKKKKEEPVKEDINIVKELLSLIIYIGAVILVCFIIITFVGCRSKVDGSSMNPTLQNEDSLWVDKLSYTFGDPKRFDIVIFDYDENTTYVKRIIGLPGETVRIDADGNIYVNEELLQENYGAERILPTKIGRASQPIKLGEDEYFVLGDNRNNSSDSRWADVGNVKREDIVGKAILRIYPFSSFGLIE